MSPFPTLAIGDLCPEEREDPFAKLCDGDVGSFPASFSERIVPSSPRLRFILRRDGPARVSCLPLPSDSSSVSDALCLRFAVGGCSARVCVAAVAVVGGSRVLAAVSGVIMWAEDIGKREAGGFGVAGRSEAIRGLGYGVVASARTNALADYPLMTRAALAAVLWL
jgi:hypothetical protein